MGGKDLRAAGEEIKDTWEMVIGSQIYPKKGLPDRQGKGSCGSMS